MPEKDVGDHLDLSGMQFLKRLIPGRLGAVSQGMLRVLMRAGKK